MWYSRYYESEVSFLKKGKVNLLYGPRRVGKTSLLEKMISQFDQKIYSGSGDDFQLRQVLSSENKSLILNAFSGYDVIFIDEAQRIQNIGWGLKILIDNLPDTLIIASGSSSFQLSSQLGEPLTGRSLSNTLFPISVLEINNQFAGMHIIENLNNHLVFGMYPEILTTTNTQEKVKLINNLRDAYLFKDILELENIKKFR